MLSALEGALMFLDLFLGSKAPRWQVISAIKLLRLHLVDVTRVLANRWVFLRHHNAGGHLQHRNKTFPHYCADGKAQAGWPVQRCKGRFLSFWFEQAVISWLHLIFIRFSNSLRAVFPFSWQAARGYVIPCDKYILTKAETVLFCHHPLHKDQGELWHGGLLLTTGIQESSPPAWREESPWGCQEHGAELDG